jgi:hypothetical protein
MTKRDRKGSANEENGSAPPFSEPERELGERIRERAYRYYVERGSSPGNELEDWLRAETEERQLADAPRPNRQNASRLNGKTTNFSQGSTASESDSTPSHRSNNLS